MGCVGLGAGCGKGGANGDAEAETGTTAEDGSSTGTDSSSTGDESSSDDGPKFDTNENLDLGYQGPVIPETCEQAAMAETTVGCLFYGVDLDTIFQNNQYAVAVANVQESQSAEITVEMKTGGMWNEVDSMMVPARDLHVFNLADLHQSGTGILAGGAYRITSDVPIIAYQFNPLFGGSETSDASMLYPVAAWDTLNHVVGWVRNPSSNQPAYVTIVAAEDATEVEVTPGANTTAGGGIPAGMAGVPFTIMLDEGDIAEIQVEAQGDTISGTVVESKQGKPVGIFTGSPCAYVPQGVFACDHLEEQLAGVRLWGERFVASRLPPREPDTPETQLWQVYASEDDTTVTFAGEAGLTGLPMSPAVMQAGELLEFEVSGPSLDPGDFVVEADKPIAILGYMTGAHSLMGFPGTTAGDPCTVQIPPVEQFMPVYVVYVPEQWENDFAVITRVPGAQVTIDDVAVPDAEFIPVGADYEVARVSIGDGVHVLEGADPFGVIVHGYDEFDSYAYIGGMGTGRINPVPEG